MAAALADGNKAPWRETPHVACEVVRFTLHHAPAGTVSVHGSWDRWQRGLDAVCIDGVWHATLPRPAAGRYSYKFFVDAATWLPDPANPLRTVDDDGNVNSVLAID
jgi:1,4-alpha-glucan branching enzyme